MVNKNEAVEQDGCKVLSDEANENITACHACTENLYKVAFREQDELDDPKSNTKGEQMDQVDLSDQFEVERIYVVSENAITNTKPPNGKTALIPDKVKRSDDVEKKSSRRIFRQKNNKTEKGSKKQKNAEAAVSKKKAYDVRNIRKTSDEQDQNSTGTASYSSSNSSIATTDEKVFQLVRKRQERNDRRWKFAIFLLSTLTAIAAFAITGTLLGIGMFRDGDPASRTPSAVPSFVPSASPSNMPSSLPSISPSLSPSLMPSATPSRSPSTSPSDMPSASPSVSPSLNPTITPTAHPSSKPSANPSSRPSLSPSLRPSVSPTSQPSSSPSDAPSASPTKPRGVISFGTTEEPFRRNSGANNSVSNHFHWGKVFILVVMWGIF